MVGIGAFKPNNNALKIKLYIHKPHRRRHPHFLHLQTSYSCQTHFPSWQPAIQKDVELVLLMDNPSHCATYFRCWWLHSWRGRSFLNNTQVTIPHNSLSQQKIGHSGMAWYLWHAQHNFLFFRLVIIIRVIITQTDG